jgi:hypothetical protein
VNAKDEDSILGEQLASSQLGQFLPFPIALGSGFLVSMIVQNILGRLTLIGSSPSFDSSKMNPSVMMKSFSAGIPPAAFQSPANSSAVPSNLPADITKAQFLILQALHKGLKKSRDIESYLSVDREVIKKEAAVLKTNGYLTKGNRLTSKGLEIVVKS